MFAAVQVLPDGFVVPPLPHLVGLTIATAAVGVLLYLVRPPVRGWDVVALGTWMAVGSAFHALHTVGAFPEWAAPLFAAPAVYVSTFVLMGVVWLVAAVGGAAGLFGSVARILGTVGASVAVSFVGFLVYLGTRSPGLAVRPLWPSVALLAAILVAGVAFAALSLTYTEAVATTGKTGAFVVFAHAFDGVSTAIGVDILCSGPPLSCERSPGPRAIMDVAAGLPTAEFVGVGWLFVAVKLLLASVVLVLFTDSVRDRPQRASLVLAGVAAVGLGPGVYNLLLYLVVATPA